MFVSIWANIPLVVHDAHVLIPWGPSCLNRRFPRPTIQFCKAECSARGSDETHMVNFDHMNKSQNNCWALVSYVLYTICFTSSTVSPIRQITTITTSKSNKSPTSTTKSRPIERMSAYPPTREKPLSTATEHLPTTGHHNRHLIFAVAVDPHARIPPINRNLIQ